MLKGFRDFILKGNVIELATAVIIGAAFTAIVTAFTDSIVQPLINAIPISADQAEGLGFQITDNANTFVNIGAVITAAINFIIVAAVVYFLIIAPYNKLAELGGFGTKSEVTEVALLTEIRDLLGGDSDSKAKTLAEKELPSGLSDPAAPAVPAAPAPQGLPPQGAPTSYPTPPPAPGAYPPPGSYPQGGAYPPPGQFPGDFPPDEPGRHSR